MTDIKDKIIGCVIGLAIGDALGAPLEGKYSSKIRNPKIRVAILPTIKQNNFSLIIFSIK